LLARTRASAQQEMPPRASSGGGSNASSGAGCPSEQYELREQIGRGAFGTVHLALHKPTRRTYVLKRVRLAKQTGWQRGSALQERALVARLAHPFIVPHIDSWVTGGHTVNIVYGYCEKGDLASLLAKRNVRLRRGG
jgi:NIMA (never in mitosis gene a)-related kinase